MSLPIIAILIASVSALFTGVNMTVSLATYRRGRPRVYMSAYWNPWAPPDWDRGGQRGYFTVRLVNRSQATVTVSNLYVEFDRGRRRSLWTARGMGRLEIIKGEGEKQIPPFGGITWTAQTDRARPLRLDDIKRARLTATLTNGTRIRGKWVPKVPRPILGPWRERTDPPGQLSFDDLSEGTQG
ncbi:hypothetical protein ABZ468_50955 [Streptomyces sp. NPDC005708]|uniref:hypothetical protein n=1 Tax=Streptomyces sp. NPDC005708 TaxID=3154564 RepID=UPI0033F2489C